MTAAAEGFTSPWWGSFNVIKKLGGHLRKGSHHTKVFWWKPVVKPDPDDPDKTRTFYVGGCEHVFNASQCDNLPDMYYPDVNSSEPDILPEPQSVIDDYLSRGPEMIHVNQAGAFYQPVYDRITLPLRSQFESAESYYCTAFHECGHSTGHETRLKRDCMIDFDHFGSDKYGREELTAEMTAAMLCALTGVPGQFDQSAAYIGSWMRAIKGDTTLVVKAARQAQSAVDMIMGTVDQDSDQDSSQRALVAA
jgi:antirestriction protein ArdC